MDKKDCFKEILKWGSENEENRKKAISRALKIIAILNDTSGRKMTEEDLKKMSGGNACACHPDW